MIRDFCTVSENEYDDFVGLRFRDGLPHVIFPRGFSLADDEKCLRRDIIRLLATIQKFSGRSEGERSKNTLGEETLSFPLLSYQYIIHDFLTHGYYTENEVHYVKESRGKINWKRTIQQIQPQIDHENIVYLDFVVKRNQINSNNLLTKIHEYCVYESFRKLGWLYLSSESLPKKPALKLNKKLFISILRQAFNNTFNDRKKQLFQSMINVISQATENHAEDYKAAFGVHRFEHVWEGMIDYVFGVDNREEFFPHARWHILSGTEYNIESSVLIPDTIMKFEEKIYILDAKYYKFGITKNPLHLPATDSIQKQITYGEHVETKHFAERNDIFNAFLMPFNRGSTENPPYKFVSVGTADWKTYAPSSPNYDYVLGILVDTTYLMQTYAKHNQSEIQHLSSLIEESLATYRLREFP